MDDYDFIGSDEKPLKFREQRPSLDFPPPRWRFHSDQLSGQGGKSAVALIEAAPEPVRSNFYPDDRGGYVMTIEGLKYLQRKLEQS